MSETATYRSPAEAKAAELGIIVDRWYWVRLAERDWFPAIYDGYVGWCNADCWEDFHNEVVEWKLIPLPADLP